MLETIEKTKLYIDKNLKSNLSASEKNNRDIIEKADVFLPYMKEHYNSGDIVKVTDVVNICGGQPIYAVAFLKFLASSNVNLLDVVYFKNENNESITIEKTEFNNIISANKGSKVGFYFRVK